MRCPDCNKWVSMETQDPEVNDLSITNDGDISAEVHLVRQCAECGTDLKETYFQTEDSIDIEEPEEPKPGEPAHEHELSIEETGCESTESGGGRYKKNMIGYTLDYKVTCDGCDFEYKGQLSDSIQASAFDEI